MRVRLTVVLILGLLGACGPTPQGGDDDDVGDDGDGGGGADAPTIDGPLPDDAAVDAVDDAATAYPDAAPFDGNGSCNDWMCTTPVNDGCMIGTSDICNDGFDNNCNGQVDEGCACTSGAVQQCFLGPPGRRGQGACVDGMMTCVEAGEFDAWGPCTGGIRPGNEACDSVDNDCNGCADDNPTCCVVELACPTTMPDGDPFQPYVINGATFYSGAVTSWQWTVTGGPCDQLFATTTNPVRQSFTLAGASTSQLTFTPSLSGDYTVTVRMTLADGTVYTCTFIVHIRGPGVRIEMCSNRSGSTDIDLHVHRPGTTTPWFTTQPGGFTINPDDCYYMTCKATTTTNIANWGYANSPLAECQGGPQGMAWQTLGYCRNPRLDIDSISANGVPENVNIDVPQNAATYRVMVQYYSGTNAAQPLINIYCGGRLRASYGTPADPVPGFDLSGGFGGGDMWRVADVTPTVTGGMTTDCMINQLHPPGQTNGYYVTTNDRSY
ncbi:MAG TPA: hypothetical protein VM261_12355 [Kofleriaceae bacterium]|nr:hypothetical protein [Kofleriaceae bacterium]